MKTLYLDCSMGAAGDMLAAALLELLPDREPFLKRMNTLGIPNVSVSAENSVKCGICGTHFSVKFGEMEEDEHLHAHHYHGSMEEIESIAASLSVPTTVKLDILAVYNLIAEAESQVHGVPVKQIHFHEVGTMDAVADITAVCLLLHELRPDRIVASPVHVGSGTVRCAHGILPVPAPATALLLRNIPTYSAEIQGELCTPTGAALLSYFVDSFEPMPVMKVQSIGYGMGKKDFSRANCVRAMLGETADPTDRVAELRCNIDDMTAEALGYAMEALLDAGALDVWTTAIGMKKSRPGAMLSVLCREGDKEKLMRQVFRHTTTIGIREQLCERYTLSRTEETIETDMGPVRRKHSVGYGVQRSKWEYEDLRRLAKEHGCSLEEIVKKIENRS